MSDFKYLTDGYANIMRLGEFVTEVKDLTDIQIESGDTPNTVFFHMMSEIGEVAEAMAAEGGSLTKKHKKMDETAKEEMVDVIQCALSLYFSLGGDTKHLSEYGKKKNAKWIKAQNESKQIDEGV